MDAVVGVRHMVVVADAVKRSLDGMLAEPQAERDGATSVPARPESDGDGGEESRRGEPLDQIRPVREPRVLPELVGDAERDGRGERADDERDEDGESLLVPVHPASMAREGARGSAAGSGTKQ